MPFATLKDILTTFAQSFRVSSVFPAAMLVIMNAYFIFPAIIQNTNSQPEASSSSTSSLIAVAATLIISYFFYAYNYPLIRVLEGYKKRDLSMHKYFLYGMHNLYQKKKREIDYWEKARILFVNTYGCDPSEEECPDLSPKMIDKWNMIEEEISRLHREMDIYFPDKKSSVLSSRFGNVVRAFEAYPTNRYGMDGVALWPRLVPLLKKDNFIDFVTQEKSVLDLLINTLVVSIILSFELFFAGFYLSDGILIIVSLVMGPIVLKIVYEGMIVAARQWGTTFRVAFDLYRHDLHHAIGLRPGQSFQEDYQRWRSVSRFYLYRSEDSAGENFLSSSQVNRRKR